MWAGEEEGVDELEMVPEVCADPGDVLAQVLPQLAALGLLGPQRGGEVLACRGGPVGVDEQVHVGADGAQVQHLLVEPARLVQQKVQQLQKAQQQRLVQRLQLPFEFARCI